MTTVDGVQLHANQHSKFSSVRVISIDRESAMRKNQHWEGISNDKESALRGIGIEKELALRGIGIEKGSAVTINEHCQTILIIDVSMVYIPFVL